MNLWIGGKIVTHVNIHDIGMGLGPYDYMFIFPQDEHEALLEGELSGDPDAALAAQLVQGVVNAGGRLLHSTPIDAVEPLTVTLAQTLVRSRSV